MEEMVQELDAHVFVCRIALTELDGDAHHVEAKHRHPGGAVGLFDIAAGRKRARTVKHPDIVEVEKAAYEYVQALRVLSIDPPGEVQQQVVKNPLQEAQITGTAP